MRIEAFSSLTEGQKRKIFDMISSFNNYFNPQSFEDMEAFYGGIAFDNGKSHFSLWEGDELIGTLGVISKEAAIRGEIFLVGLNLAEPYSDKLDMLLSKAFEYCSHIDKASCKLGIMPYMRHLIPGVLENGFRETYRNLEMKYYGSMEGIPQDIDRGFESIGSANVKEFQKVHNKSFLTSPNGAPIEDEELQELLEDYSGDPELAGLYFEDSIPAGIYLLKIKDGAGWIDGIGVHPSLQGRGIGKKLLLKSVKVLKERGVSEIKLSVFDINKNAVRLYLNNGFKIEREHSIWYEK